MPSAHRPTYPGPMPPKICRSRLGLAAISVVTFAATPAHASEGGVSFYLLGLGGPGAGLMPPLPGVFFDNTFYHFHGDAGAERQFVVGGNLVAGIDATVDANFTTIMWVPSTNFAGGTLALAAAIPIGQPNIDVSAILTGPRGGQVTIERSDKAFMVADPIATASLGWNLGGDFHFAATATVNVPIGHYREGELANLSFHRWIVDLSAATSWHNVKSGWDVSAKAGFTFNGTNDFNDYNTGTEFHIEGAIEHSFSKQFSLGVQGYHFQQVTGDTGSGAVLGPFKGRVSGVGATAAYNFDVGKTPVTARGRLFKEFGEKNRLDDGTSIMFSLSLPFHMKMPPAPAPPPPP